MVTKENKIINKKTSLFVLLLSSNAHGYVSTTKARAGMEPCCIDTNALLFLCLYDIFVSVVRKNIIYF
jgi:hypothetical protein